MFSETGVTYRNKDAYHCTEKNNTNGAGDQKRIYRLTGFPGTSKLHMNQEWYLDKSINVNDVQMSWPKCKQHEYQFYYMQYNINEWVCDGASMP